MTADVQHSYSHRGGGDVRFWTESGVPGGGMWAKGFRCFVVGDKSR